MMNRCFMISNSVGIRVVYAASGTLPCALVISNSRAIIEHANYWSKVASLDEGHYLATILNSETARSEIEALQSRGQWGARHFDKVMFTLPIPRFDPSIELHRQLAAAGDDAARLANLVELEEGTHFQTARRQIRKALVSAGVSDRVERLVARLLAKQSSAGAV